MPLLSGRRLSRKTPPSRYGSATVELAVVLPVLLLIAVIAVDCGRFGKYAVTVTNAARCGAIYGSQNNGTAGNNAGISSAVMADITNNLEVAASKIQPVVVNQLQLQGLTAIQVTVTVEFDLIVSFGTHNIFYGGSFLVTDTCTMPVLSN